MLKVLLHKGLHEGSLQASFYRKAKETGTEKYSMKKVLKEDVQQYGFSTTVENMLTTYNQQFYLKSTLSHVLLIGFS